MDFYTLDPNKFTSMVDPSLVPLGLPQDTQPTSPPPGLESTTASVSDPAPISTVDKIWNTIKSDSSSAVNYIEQAPGALYSGTKSAISTIYTDVASGVSTVANDVTSPLRSTYWYLIVAVVVIAGALYFIGKGGAVKVNAIV